MKLLKLGENGRVIEVSFKDDAFVFKNKGLFKERMEDHFEPDREIFFCRPHGGGGVKNILDTTTMKLFRRALLEGVHHEILKKYGNGEGNWLIFYVDEELYKRKRNERYNVVVI